MIGKCFERRKEGKYKNNFPKLLTRKETSLLFSEEPIEEAEMFKEEEKIRRRERISRAPSNY